MLTTEEIQYKIDYEIVVDCYDDIEVSMGWYYSFESELEFPFYAIAQLKNKQKETFEKQVKVVGIHSKEEDITYNDFMLEIEYEGIIMPVYYSKLSNIKAFEQSMDILQCWDYWTKR